MDRNRCPASVGIAVRNHRNTHYEHLEKGYQAFIIHKEIEEGLNLFQIGQRQVFYFDDFMGATFLGDQSSSIAGNNDRALLEFIEMVRATPTARFILTTASISMLKR